MTEVRTKYLDTVTVQASGSLTADEDPTSGSYTGGATTVLNSTHETETENACGAEGATLTLSVTAAPALDAKAEIWMRGSHDNISWTEWAQSHEVPADISNAGAASYDAGFLFLSYPYIELKIVAKTVGFTATLSAVPFLQEAEGVQKTVNEIGETGSNQTLDLSTYQSFEIKPTAALSISAGGLGTSSRAEADLHIESGGDHSITWGDNFYWPEGSAPTLSSATSSVVISDFSNDNIKNFVFADETSRGRMTFNSDGTSVFFADSNRETIFKHSLSSAYDLSTMSTDPTQSAYIGLFARGFNGLEFSSDGSKLYLADATNELVAQCSLDTAWDLSTLAYEAELDISAKETGIQGLIFKSDGTKLYIVGTGMDAVNQYNYR